MTGFRLELMRFETRFWLSFSHATASRSKAASVVCCARGDDGLTGYGEGCPRDYVTGETLSSVTSAFAHWKDALERDVQDLPSLRRWIVEHQDEIDAAPAAFAAIELALLDLFARRAKLPLEAFLGLDAGRSVTVSAVFGIAGPLLSGLLAAGYRSFGMVDAKIKLSADPDSDRRRIGMISSLLGPAAHLRADANNHFAHVDACVRHLDVIDQHIWAIEEPLSARDWEGMSGVIERADVRVILDESAVRPADLDAVEGDRWIVNLRVSKHGGLLRSIEMAKAAMSRGLDLVIGSHVGETSLLARAALALAAACGDRLMAAECGYGSFLLRRDLVRPSLRFGKGGLLDRNRTAGDDGSGLGLGIDEALLLPMTA